MAHHGQDPKQFEGFKGDFKDITDPSRLMETFRKPPIPPNLGATGNFPDGKITNDDEGEIRIGITTKDDTVVLDFGKPVAWIGFTKEQAKEIGELLIKRSQE